MEAARGGDIDGLLAMLSPDVVLRADDGRGELLVVNGARAVATVATRARFFSTASAAHPAIVDGTAGVVATEAGAPVAVLTITVTGGTPDGVLFGRLTTRTRRASAKGPIMRTQRRLSDSERAERRERDRERLKQAAEQLLSSEGWQRWVRVRARGGLARLLLNNQLLVVLSCPHATFVAGFRAWLNLGYCVRKGEKAIRIIAPMPIKPRETETADGDDETRVLFKGVSVFDRSQVAPVDRMSQVPLEPPSKSLTGDSHANLLEPTHVFAESLGFTVSFESIPGATGGWCDQTARRIVVDSGQPANAQLGILIHETIHGLGVGYAEYGRARAEVIVDTANLIVLGAVGLDTSDETVPYVAGWGETGALEAVTEFAQLIDTLARRVEAAITPSEDVESAANTLLQPLQGACI